MFRIQMCERSDETFLLPSPGKRRSRKSQKGRGTEEAAAGIGGVRAEDERQEAEAEEAKSGRGRADVYAEIRHEGNRASTRCPACRVCVLSPYCLIMPKKKRKVMVGHKYCCTMFSQYL